ncbi:hypothetical protein GJ744_001470 [Endocarpon pusillum]|uniref:Trichodiene oxygenase n=1 Tax=Endocarpon pusillum TaxID=364733 RepID=A0A8H7E3B4_9EURO|nr:hypothetical protein GJ744_001470 [Endocarpon pusillum]
MEKMHRKYGPIVRINPRELHIQDPHYYSTIYTGSTRKVNKDALSVGAFDVPTSTAATIDHNHHRARRSYLSSYFSKRSLSQLEPIIHERIGKLCGRLEEAMQQGEVISLDGAFSALTADIITLRFYGQHSDYLSIKNFRFVVRDAFIGLSQVYHMGRLLPLIANLLKHLPIPIIRMIMPSVADLLNLREEIKHNAAGTLKAKNTIDFKSVIVGSLADHTIPAEERTFDRMVDEGIVIIFAGTETTSRALSVTFFYLLSNESLLKRLRDELDTLPSTQDNAYSLTQLEALPFLAAVIQEGLRLSFGPVSRMPRVSPHDALQYKDYVIPPGTPVSQSAYFVHTDPSIYPDPHTFDPDRWIRAAQEGVVLDKYIANFTKGRRQCLGINMSYTELYLTIARIVRSFTLELHDTTKDDIDIYHARIVGFPRQVKGQKEAHGEVQVKVTGKIVAK